jgi:hypothetical protein
MVPTPPAPPDGALDEKTREDAKGAADGSGAEVVLDGAAAGIDLLSIASEAGNLAAGAARVSVEGVATIAQASIEVLGGILGGLTDL